MIFDLGGVVFNWNPDNVVRQCFPDPRDREKALTHFMKHPEWLELDRGIMDRDVILQNASERSGLSLESIEAVWNAAPRSLTVKDGTIGIIKRLKKKGHKLYVLSNMPHDPIDYLTAKHSFFKMFDGIVASCHVGMIKPEKEIYAHILEEYSLKAEESVFIDDLAENLAEPEAMGIHCIRFISEEKLEEELSAEGWL